MSFAGPAAPATYLPPLWQLPAAAAMRKRPGRGEFHPWAVESKASARLQARALPQQGSDVLSSVRPAQALVVLEHERGDAAVGEAVAVWPLQGLF